MVGWNLLGSATENSCWSPTGGYVNISYVMDALPETNTLKSP